jgi:hypothetical protein
MQIPCHPLDTIPLKDMIQLRFMTVGDATVPTVRRSREVLSLTRSVTS